MRYGEYPHGTLRSYGKTPNGDDGGNRRAVLVDPLATEHPSRPSVKDQLKDELDRAWAARPLNLRRNAGEPILMLEDANDEPPERLLGVHMKAERFLHLAIGFTIALGKLRQRGLVRKDIKPANRRSAVDEVRHRRAPWKRGH